MEHRKFPQLPELTKVTKIGDVNGHDQVSERKVPLKTSPVCVCVVHA